MILVARQDPDLPAEGDEIAQLRADLIEVGAYTAGTNPRVDRALRTRGNLLAFLRQAPDEHVPFPQALAQLERIVSDGARA